MTNDKDIDSLLAKYLAEETDSIEENLFDEWLEESDEHQKIWTQSKILEQEMLSHVAYCKILNQKIFKVRFVKSKTPL